MKITLFRKQKDGSGETIVNEGFSHFIERIKTESRDGYIQKYRDVYNFLETPNNWVNIHRIPMVCPVSEWYKKTSGQREFRLYNGVSVVTVDNLANQLEIEKVKRCSALNPQTLCAFKGADGHSVHIFTLATLPDGTLPKKKELAELFCAKAYATSVMAYAPLIDFKISIEAPSLDKCIMLTVDEMPYVNPHPTPFIIEQPTSESLNTYINKVNDDNQLDRLKPGPESYVTLTQIFNFAYMNAIQSSVKWDKEKNSEQLIVRVADECAICGLPEEEVVTRLGYRFSNVAEQDIRTTVRSVYEEHKHFGSRSAMSKHQLVAFKLREFLKRRYEIRFNEILQMTEYRERQSLQFFFKELSRRELNTIHHESTLEGIESNFGEVEELVHSTYVPIYNPIADFLENLPKWDGKDRLKALAKMVPNNNEHWEPLFTRWFLSMVAHWMNCDTVHANQTAPILIGAQGYRKSTFCRLLLPPELQTFFTDSIDFRTNIEAERCLSRFLLVNIDEFDQLSEKQFSFVKHLFQKPVTNIRRMYSETIGTQRRYASFIGTSNHNEILRDPTGNRRYLCVEVTAPIHTEVAIDYAQLYAQAKHLILNGERYWLNDEDEAIIRKSNETFEVASVHEQLFFAAFTIPTQQEDGEWLPITTIMEVLQTLPSFNRKTDNNITNLGKALTKLKSRGLLKKRDGKILYCVRRK